MSQNEGYIRLIFFRKPTRPLNYILIIVFVSFCMFVLTYSFIWDSPSIRDQRIPNFRSYAGTLIPFLGIFDPHPLFAFFQISKNWAFQRKHRTCGSATARTSASQPNVCLWVSPGVSSLGVPGVPWHSQILANQLTLSQPREADYAHHIILTPPDFQTFLRPWLV